MPAFIIFILIALAVSFYGTAIKTKEITQPVQKELRQSFSPVQPKSLPKSQKEIAKQSPTSSISIETFIKYGPLEKEIIEDTNQVIFEFAAKVFPENTPGQIYFETKMEGIDQDWQKTFSQEREITLPPGPKEYAFWVRAKINETVDLTPAQRNFKLNISPYFKKLTIASVQTPTFYNPSLITLNSQLNSSEKIKITSWKIESKETKKSFFIPQGTEKYDSLNPLFKEDIYVKSGDRILISSAASPLWNVNFRVNKCSGYLTELYNFPIPVSKSCPWPRQDRLPRYLSQDCQDYIKSRRNCEMPKYDKLVEKDILKDSNCLNYLDSNFNYPSCFANYSKDQDFLSQEWHIYLNRFPDKEILDWPGDTIYLRDQNGLLVDKYSYTL